jgi:hypothetical protein
MPQKKTRRASERRNRPRADARLSMRVESAPDLDTPQIVTESQNISASGVYCTSSHYLSPLSKVALTIVLPKAGARATKELIKCEGIVVRCQPSGKKNERSYELACMFSGLDPEHRVLLDDFVAWRNLQALRAAAGGTKNGRARKPRTRTSAAARKPKARPKAAARRRTVH